MPTTDQQTARLLGVIAGAASFGERATASWLRPAPAPDDGVLQTRRDNWLQATAGGDENAFRELLRVRGIAPDAVHFCLRNVVATAESDLPAWARAVMSLWSFEPKGIKPLGTLTGRDVVGREIDLCPHLAPDAPWPHQRAFDALLGAAHELGSIDTLQLPGIEMRDGWLDVFALYPALARVLATLYVNWVASNAEMLERLGRDREILEESFAAGRSLGRLERCALGAGDPHAGGQTVTMLTFAGGETIVYKPKDLSIGAAFMEIVGNINDHGFDKPLRVRRIVPRGAYAWEEFVESKTCDDEAQVADYYFRMGAYARLLQLLEAVDFIGENIVACGDQPVLIDLETILSPRPAFHVTDSATDRLIAEKLRDSPVGIGLINAKIAGVPGRRPIDVGAMCAASTAETPFKQAVFRKPSNETGHIGWGYVNVALGTSTPTVGKRTVAPSDYFANVLDGYRAMARCLRDEACNHDVAEQVAAMGEMPARFLHRNTHIYARMLQESVTPDRLRNGISRELCLERLWRARLRTDTPPAIIQREIDELREMDFPMFFSLPGGDQVRFTDGGEVTRYFGRPAADRVLDRLRQLTTRSIERECDNLATLLHAVEPRARVARPPASGDAPRRSRDRWLEEAITIGDVILEQAVRAPGDGPAWIGLDYSPLRDTFALGRLRDDLLSGNCGLALVLIELYRATGSDRFRVTAEDILDGAAARLEVPSERPAGPRANGPVRFRPYYCGGFFGAGSQIHALLAGAQTLSAPRFTEPVAAWISSASPNVLCASSPADMISGMAGLLLVLTSGHAETVRSGPAAAALQRLCAAVAEGLAASRDADGSYPAPPYPTGARQIDNLPTTDLGIELALARHAPLADDNDDLSTSVPTDEEAATQRYFEGLEFLGAGSEAADLSVVPSAALIDGIEAAIGANSPDGDKESWRRAKLLGTELIRRHDDTGSWFPDVYAADHHNLSVITGISAVAHAFLRLYSNGSVPSVRLLG